MTAMHTRPIGGVQVSAIGLGCMNLSHAYGAPPGREAALALVRRALDLGITHFDTAALYGFGSNEELLGSALGADRERIFLASKCGATGVAGRRVIDGRPETLRHTCLESLARLRTAVIDLYYLHRWDKQVPIEDSVGALADLVRAGHIRAIGLSEVSAATLRRAHAVHPIAALQSEYSVWTRNPDVAVLAECRRLGVAFVAFSPLGRGFFGGSAFDPGTLPPRDIRLAMPRFQPPHLALNAALASAFGQLACEAGCSPSQLCLAWLLQRGVDVLPIPGTSSIAHLEQNVGAADLRLDPVLLARIESLLNPDTVSGARYSAENQREVDTEEM
jgi:aryl-alcohol dehydrogenase-like predicted oxidoreductase